MSTNILSKDKQTFEKHLVRNIAIAIVCAVVVVALNVVFSVLRDEQNHKIMLALNIIVDIIGGWFLVFFVGYVILHQVRLKNLYNQQGEQVRVEVVAISQTPQKYRSFDCCKVDVKDCNEERTYFLPTSGNVELHIGQSATLRVVSNIIVEKYE